MQRHVAGEEGGAGLGEAPRVHSGRHVATLVDERLQRGDALLGVPRAVHGLLVEEAPAVVAEHVHPEVERQALRPRLRRAVHVRTVLVGDELGDVVPLLPGRGRGERVAVLLHELRLVLLVLLDQVLPVHHDVHVAVIGEAVHVALVLAPSLVGVGDVRVLLAVAVLVHPVVDGNDGAHLHQVRQVGGGDVEHVVVGGTAEVLHGGHEHLVHRRAGDLDLDAGELFPLLGVVELPAERLEAGLGVERERGAAVLLGGGHRAIGGVLRQGALAGAEHQSESEAHLLHHGQLPSSGHGYEAAGAAGAAGRGRRGVTVASALEYASTAVDVKVHAPCAQGSCRAVRGWEAALSLPRRERGRRAFKRPSQPRSRGGTRAAPAPARPDRCASDDRGRAVCARSSR